jgi:hypothetical protein
MITYGSLKMAWKQKYIRPDVIHIYSCVFKRNMQIFVWLIADIWWYPKLGDGTYSSGLLVNRPHWRISSNNGESLQLYKECTSLLAFMLDKFEENLQLIWNYTFRTSLIWNYYYNIQVTRNPPGDLSYWYRHRSKGAWALSTIDNGWVSTDSSAEAFTVSTTLWAKIFSPNKWIDPTFLSTSSMENKHKEEILNLFNNYFLTWDLTFLFLQGGLLLSRIFPKVDENLEKKQWTLDAVDCLLTFKVWFCIFNLYLQLCITYFYVFLWFCIYS